MRDPRDQAGLIENAARRRPRGDRAASRRFAIVGTLKATDPELRSRLLEAHKAGTLSRQYGLSHAASIKTQIVREGSDTFSDVTDIGDVESVDVVGKPAAGGRFDARRRRLGAAGRNRSGDRNVCTDSSKP
jgi:hypothetical protein